MYNDTKMKSQQSKKEMLKFIIDFIPLLLFFVAFKASPEVWVFSKSKPVIFATFVLMVSTVSCLVALKLLNLEINKLNMYSSFAVVAFGLLTLFFNNENFIKIKVTIVNIVIAFVFFYFSFIKKKSLVQGIFAGKIKMDLNKWLILDKRFMIMFVVIGISNEIFWRCFSTEFWVFYKVFLIAPITIVFLIFQFPFLKKYGVIDN